MATLYCPKGHEMVVSDFVEYDGTRLAICHPCRHAEKIRHYGTDVIERVTVMFPPSVWGDEDKPITDLPIVDVEEH